MRSKNVHEFLVGRHQVIVGLATPRTKQRLTLGFFGRVSMAPAWSES